MWEREHSGGRILFGSVATMAMLAFALRLLTCGDDGPPGAVPRKAGQAAASLS